MSTGNGRNNGSGQTNLTPTPQLDPNIARQFLAGHHQKRSQACQRAIEAALKRHRCIMVPEITLTGT